VTGDWIPRLPAVRLRRSFREVMLPPAAGRRRRGEIGDEEHGLHEIISSPLSQSPRPGSFALPFGS
jgi:hypothetical protein